MKDAQSVLLNAPLMVHRKLRERIHLEILRLANNLLLIGVVYAASLLAAALLFSQFEHKSFGTSLWWAVVTALTIGYGDIDPVTTAGRVTAVLFQHFWIFGVAPLVIANIIGRVQRDRDKYTHEEQEWMKQSIVLIAKALKVTLPPLPDSDKKAA